MKTRQKCFSTIIALGVALAFIVSGCATLNSFLGIKDYYTVDMYMSDGTPMPTNFPNEWPNMDKENAFCMPMLGVGNVVSMRCIVKDNEFTYIHIMERHTGKDIALMIMAKDGTFVNGWIYDAKGIPNRANHEAIQKAFTKYTPELKGDTV